MKAVALTRYLPIDDPQSLIDVELPEPAAPAGHDLRVRIEAVSVNPVEPRGALKIGDPYKAKCIGIHWEMMFARPRFRTADQDEQGRILARVAELVDAGELRTTHAQTLGRIDAANLRRARALLESGRTLGKLVLARF